MNLRAFLLLLVWIGGWFALGYSDAGNLKDAAGTAGAAALFGVFVIIFFGDD